MENPYRSDNLRVFYCAYDALTNDNNLLCNSF